MIRINQLKLNIAHTQSDLERKILKTLHMKKEYLQGYKIRRQSIDARKKPDLYYVYSVDVLVKDEAKIKKSIKSNQIQFQAKEDAYNFPANGTRTVSFSGCVLSLASGKTALKVNIRQPPWSRQAGASSGIQANVCFVKDVLASAAMCRGLAFCLCRNVAFQQFADQSAMVPSMMWTACSAVSASLPVRLVL